MFGSSYKKETAYSQNDWIAILGNDSGVIISLCHFNSLIGWRGVTLKKANIERAILFSSFILKQIP